jgi:GH24 family phage-related lysozyme (muramidase)
MPTYLDESITKLESFEGVIPWMYLDTEGHVTVGVGLMLPDVQAALRLPFQLSGRAATEAEISAEFARVDALPMGRAALFYRGKNSPELTREGIDSLLRTVLTGFEGELRGALHGYDGFPDPVKLALLDMIYNLGPAGLLKGYPRLMKSLAAGNWAEAAGECLRHGPGAARNEWTRQQFLSSVVAKIHAAGENGWKRFGFGLLGLGAAALEKFRGIKDR